MAVTDSGGGAGSGLPPYMYEQLRELVYADDPGEIREIGQWLRDRGRTLSHFTHEIVRELGRIEAVYSSVQGAPALIRQLQNAVDELQALTDDVIHNGHTLTSAADALQAARHQVDSVRPEPGPDGATATWRTDSPYTDPLTRAARPHVERLNTYLYNLGDDLALVPPGAGDLENPGNPPTGDESGTGTPGGRTGAGSEPPRGTGAFVPRVGPGGSAADAGRSVPGSRPGALPPASGRGPMAPGDGVVAPGADGARRGREGGSTGGAGTGAEKRVRVPGGAGGDILGRLRSPSPGGAVSGGSAGGESPTGGEASRAGGGAPGRPVPSAPGSGGGVPGLPGAHSGGAKGSPGKRKPGYERGEPDLFVDGRRANTVGGEIRAESQSRKVTPGPGVIGSQKHKHVEETRHGDWQLPQATPTPEGFPDEFREGRFRNDEGVQFEVKDKSRRARGR